VAIPQEVGWGLPEMVMAARHRRAGAAVGVAETEQVSLRVVLSLSYYRPTEKENAGVTRPVPPRTIRSGGRRLSIVYPLPPCEAPHALQDLPVMFKEVFGPAS
jgi:hypothetical protein